MKLSDQVTSPAMKSRQEMKQLSAGNSPHEIAVLDTLLDIRDLLIDLNIKLTN